MWVSLWFGWSLIRRKWWSKSYSLYSASSCFTICSSICLPHWLYILEPFMYMTSAKDWNIFAFLNMKMIKEVSFIHSYFRMAWALLWLHNFRQLHSDLLEGYILCGHDFLNCRLWRSYLQTSDRSITLYIPDTDWTVPFLFLDW